MSRLGKGELVYGELLSVDETPRAHRVGHACRRRRVAGEVLGQPLSLGAVGPFDVSELESSRRMSRA